MLAKLEIIVAALFLFLVFRHVEPVAHNAKRCGHSQESNWLEKKPQPGAKAAAAAAAGAAAAVLVAVDVVVVGRRAGQVARVAAHELGVRLRRVAQRVHLHAVQIVVLRQLTRARRKAHKRRARQVELARVGNDKAVLPLVLALDVEVHGEELVAHKRDAGAGHVAGVVEAAAGAAADLVGEAVVRGVVLGLAVAHHGHDVGEGLARAVVLVGVKEDAEALEAVRGAKHGPRLALVRGDPEGHAVAVQRRALAVDFKVKLDLEVLGDGGELGEEPAGLAGAVAGEADKGVRADQRAAAVVVEAGRQVLVQERARERVGIGLEAQEGVVGGGSNGGGH